MRVTLLAVFILLFSGTNGQSISQLTGTWKIIIIDQTEVYYNCKTDSISFSKGMAAILPDTPTQKNTAQAIKATVCNYQFIFKSDSKFKFIADSILLVVEGNYEEVPAKKIIQLSNKKSVGLEDFDLPDKIRYSIKDGLLYLLMEEDEDHKLILRKHE